MHYVVDATSGARFGPYDRSTLQQFLNEGRIQPVTLLIDAASGEQSLVRDVLGLSAPPLQAPLPMSGPRVIASADPVGRLIKTSYQMIFAGFLCCPVVPNLYGIYLSLRAMSMGSPRGVLPLLLNGGALLLCCGAFPALSSLANRILGLSPGSP